MTDHTRQVQTRANTLATEWAHLLKIRHGAEKVVEARDTGGHVNGWINNLQRILKEGTT
jgi:hypothetical protein